MKLFFKRLSVYWLCFFVCYLPYRQVQAAIPLAAVVLDVVAGSALAVAADTIITKAICGKKPWGANDPVFACNAKTPKSKWLDKAKGSAKWAALLAAASLLINDSGSYNVSTGDCTFVSPGNISFEQCISEALKSLPKEPGYELKIEPSTSVNNSGHQTYYWMAYYSNGSRYKTKGAYSTLTPESPEISEDQLANDFWKTSPDVPSETWLPDSTPATPNPVHPDPEWFPSSDPVTTPYTPSPSYPQTLPDSHPDKRPASDPKPDYGDFPFDLPGSWPSDWPEPGSVPVSPGDFPLEWPLPGATPLPDPTPTPDPTPDPDKPTDPDIPVDPSPLPNPLPVIGPLTRTEFEQVQAKNFSEATTNLPDPNFQKHQDEITKAMNDFIADSVDVVVPEFGFNPFGYFSYGGGSCIAFSFNLSIGGKTKNVTFDSHCPPFEDYVRPTLEWSLYLSTGLYLYMMFTRTVRSL
ncbi:hypothetical protein BCU71_25510 [Vibrio lentus]|uniref:hypothetical protein n=1 Tax=Vibrio lentus TaxID=136468 RepID=UPI000C867D4D|nr:hypothetical protein [Vibrio lentus]PMH25240.1 hypothetical protein BCU71_25510 [Vibrio lentus]PMK66272.1 hypothetical protein BCT93_08785 [Vibrio lentus]